MESQKKTKKINIVKDLIDNLSSSKSFLIFDYQGISAEHFTTLRQLIKKNDNRLQAVKKNLLLKALSEINKNGLTENEFAGQTAVVLINSNPIETIKTISNFSKTHKKPIFLRGFFENDIIEPNDYLKLSLIASREMLIAQTVGLIKNPINRLILQTKSNQQKLVLVLRSVAEKKM